MSDGPAERSREQSAARVHAAATRTDSLVLVDDPAPHVRRITLNRPEKRNALNHRCGAS